MIDPPGGPAFVSPRLSPSGENEMLTTVIESRLAFRPQSLKLSLRHVEHVAVGSSLRSHRRQAMTVSPDVRPTAGLFDVGMMLPRSYWAHQREEGGGRLSGRRARCRPVHHQHLGPGKCASAGQVVLDPRLSQVLNLRS